MASCGNEEIAKVYDQLKTLRSSSEIMYTFFARSIFEKGEENWVRGNAAFLSLVSTS